MREVRKALRKSMSAPGRQALPIVSLLTAIGAATPAVAIDCGAELSEAKFSVAMAMCGTASRPVRFGVAQAADTPQPTGVMMAGGQPAPTSHQGRKSKLRYAAAAVPAPVRATAVASDPLITEIGQRYRVDPNLLAAMVRTESAGRMDAISSKGALGLMQVMPATARSLGVEPSALLTDRALALSTGALYLKTLQARLGNNVPLVVAAYNAGPGAVLKAGMRVPSYRETQGYVGQVMGRYIATVGAQLTGMQR